MMERGRYVSLPSADVHVVDSGGPGAPVVLVHGLGGQHTNWLDVREGLGRFGRVVSLDLPGFGLSPPLETHGAASFARVVAEMIESLDAGPALLVGNSMGGLVSEMAASRSPDLIAHLVLIAPAAISFRSRPPSPSLAVQLALQSFEFPGSAIVALYRRASTPEQQALRTLDLVTADRRRISEEITSASIEMATLRRSMPWAVRAMVESTASIRRTLLDRDGYRDLIESIAAPTLVLSGAHDRLVTAAAVRALTAMRPDWTSVEHPDSGHVPQMEHPAWVIDQMDAWLASAPAARLVAP